jgi:serine/threonine-protein kinase
MSDCPVRIGDILADKYRVDAILGMGGMGVVVSAWHIELERRFAMKFLLPSLAQNFEAAERFRREARASARIQSENVARVLDVGTMDGGVPFMVMEYLEGHDLATELGRGGALSVTEAVDFVLQASCAIAEAHAKGIVHRDLKPANLFLTMRSDHTKLIKVFDFGISKSLTGSNSDQSLTRTAALVGSPLYMSPEQLESARDVDLRTDIWSLGVILFELMTGSVPFAGDNMPQLVRAVLAARPPRASDVRKEIPEGLSDVIERCLRLDLSERFSNVGELAAALAAFTPEGERYMHSIRRVLKNDSRSSSFEAVAPASVEAESAGLQPAPSKAIQEPRENARLVIEDTVHSARIQETKFNDSSVKSWGLTAHGKDGRRRRLGLAVGVIGVVAVVAIVVFLMSHREQPSDSAAAAASDLAAVPVVEATHEAAIADPSAVSTASAAPSPSAMPTAGADSKDPTPEPPEATSAAASSAVPTSGSKAPSAVSQTERLSSKTPIPKKPTKPTATPTPSPASSSSKFTDFGGRR